MNILTGVVGMFFEENDMEEVTKDWEEVKKIASSAFKLTYFIAIAVAMHHLMEYAKGLEFTGLLISYLGAAILGVEFTSKSLRYMAAEIFETWRYLKSFFKKGGNDE